MKNPVIVFCGCSALFLLSWLMPRQGLCLSYAKEREAAMQAALEEASRRSPAKEDACPSVPRQAQQELPQAPIH